MKKKKKLMFFVAFMFMIGTMIPSLEVSGAFSALNVQNVRTQNRIN